MLTLPSSESASGASFTVADFYESARAELGLKLLVGGKGLEHLVEEPIVNRPGLALTGFYEHFAWQRVQLIGQAETAYLSSLDPKTRRQRLGALIERGAYCFVFAHGGAPQADDLKLAEKAGVVILTTPMKTRIFANRSAFVLERLGAPSMTIYGTMVEVNGLGVLFECDPGLGKSETALGLIKRGAALIADDLTCIRKDFGTGFLYGSASESTAGYMEIRGIGIMHIPSIFGINAVRSEKRLGLVITFRLMDEVRGEIDRIGQTRKVRTLLGTDVPNIIIPVSEGRDLVNLVETAAQQQKLIMTGHDPVATLSERLRLRVDSHIVSPAKPAKRRGKSNG